MARPIPGPAAATAPDFVAVDVETANSDAASICQIGVARFAGGRLLDNHAWLINPRTFFSAHNIAIHGIRAADVDAAPTWADLYPDVVALLGGQIVVSHTAFDVTAIARACARADLAPIAARWLDSARVARRAFPCFARRGWGLASLSDYLQIEFAHHDAGEDARAAGQVVLAAIAHSGLSAEDWLFHAHRPLRAFAPLQDASR